MKTILKNSAKVLLLIVLLPFILLEFVIKLLLFIIVFCAFGFKFKKTIDSVTLIKFGKKK